MYEELRINSEESDAIDSFNIFSYRGFDYFYNDEYDGAIKNMEKALDAIEIYLPTNIKFTIENLTHRLFFLGLRNEILLQLGISYRKLGFYYKAKEIFEGLIRFTEDFKVRDFLGFEEMILGYYPISRNELLSVLWSEIGYIYKDLKLYNKALNAFYKSTHTSSIKASIMFRKFSYLNPWLEIAYLHEQLGDFKKAKLAKKKFKKREKKVNPKVKLRRWSIRRIRPFVKIRRITEKKMKKMEKRILKRRRKNEIKNYDGGIITEKKWKKMEKRSISNDNCKN